MIRWYHAILSAYGYWLPNDPRGSWSDFVYAWELYRFGGAATKVTGRRSYAHDPHDAAFRREAKEHLKYAPARFDGASRTSIATGFESACAEFGFCLHACAIGFDHVHLIAARNAERSIEQVVAVLKSRASRQMKQDGTHPMRAHPDCPTAWGRGLWKVFIHEEVQLHSALRYVTQHPMKEGLPPQPWRFLTPV